MSWDPAFRVVTFWTTTAGAIYSTTGDLYRWDRALITGVPRLVPSVLLRQIFTLHARCPYQSCPLPADRGYGSGWFAGGTGPAKLVNHSGSVLGFCGRSQDRLLDTSPYRHWPFRADKEHYVKLAVHRGGSATAGYRCDGPAGTRRQSRSTSCRRAACRVR